jgi:hypothetical protein
VRYEDYVALGQELARVRAELEDASEAQAHALLDLEAVRTDSARLADAQLTIAALKQGAKIEREAADKAATVVEALQDMIEEYERDVDMSARTPLGLKAINALRDYEAGR